MLGQADLEAAQRHLDEHGYCVVEGAISGGEAAALRERLLEQVAAEERLGRSRILPDKKQIVTFLINKGQGFRDLLFHPTLRALVGHVLGPQHLLSSYVGHIAHPGGTKVFHTDQWWMPPPTNAAKETLLRPGSITHDHRGHYRLGEAGRDPVAIASACCCNTMWVIDDFTADNGATIVVPGSHLFGRQPDPDLAGLQPLLWFPADAHARGSLKGCAHFISSTTSDHIPTLVAQYHPSVHVYALSRHVTCVFRSKERRHLGNLFWCLLAA